MRCDLENPMVIDANWRHLEPVEPEVVGYCEGCGDEITKGQWIFEINGFMIHDEAECCKQYLGSISVEKEAK